MIQREPDVTVLIDMDPSSGLERALSRGDDDNRFESFGEDLQKQMRAGFLELAQEFSDRFDVINGAQSIEDVARDVARAVHPRIDAAKQRFAQVST